MRLNRVLQITAAISITLAAMMFTISCSDGEDGKNGADCNVTGDEGDYTVICGGEQVGKLTNGPKGNEGTPGVTGQPGVDCELRGPFGNSYEIWCGGTKRSSLEGCSTESSTDEVQVSCEGNPTVSLCKGEVFDASAYYCTSTGKASNTSYKCGINDTPYNPLRQYCGFTSEAAVKAGTPTVLPLCNASLPVASTSAAVATMKPNLASSSSNKWVLDAASGPDWKDEYCQVTVASANVATGAVTYAKAKSDPTTSSCNGVKVKINEDTWKGQYCGFKEASDNTKSIVSNACGDGQGPDAVSYGDKYCRMLNKTDSLTTTSAVFCAVGNSSSSVKTPINKVEKAEVTIADWKDEYCGYDSEADVTSKTLSLRTGTCDYIYSASSYVPINYGPNALPASGSYTWANQYCQVQYTHRDSAKTTLVSGVTTDKVGLNYYCIAKLSEFKTAGSGDRLNENVWQDQYCAYTDTASVRKKEPAIRTGICGNSEGPNSATLSSTTWGNDYCQASKNGSTMRVGGLGAYCGIATLAGVEGDYLGSINNGQWNDEYCGFNKAADLSAFNSASSVADKAAKLSVLLGTCDYEGVSTLTTKGPNAYTVPSSGIPSGTSSLTWANEYCQAVGYNNDSTIIVGIISGTGKGFIDNVGIYCLADTATALTNAGSGATYITVLSNSTDRQRLNEGSWQNQYCGFANKQAFDDGKFSILKTVCGDGNGVNPVSLNWTNDYCQGNYFASGTKKVSGSSIAKNVYCASDISSNFGTMGSTNRLNEGSWKGEFCFADDIKAKCTGGWIPNGYVVGSGTFSTSTTAKNSTDEDKCVTP